MQRKKPITKFSTDRPGLFDSMRTSSKPLHKVTHLGALLTNKSHTTNDKNNSGSKYKHEAFLQPNVFNSYKELLAV